MKEFFVKIKLKIALLLIAAFISVIASAQTAPAAPAIPDSSLNPLWWLVLGALAVLVIAILLLSGVLANLVRLMVEKQKVGKATTLILLLLISATAFAQDAQVPVATKAAGNALPDWNIIMAATVMITLVFVVLILLMHIRSILNELSEKKEVRKPIEFHFPKLFDTINASVSVEREIEVMLDHDYDGIHELDNKLPPWWVYGFYGTIIFAVVYLFYYNFGGGPSSHEEYAIQMAEAKIAKDEYMLKNALNVDENTVKMADAVGIDDGKTIFAANCAVCHGANGQGVVGPNLTDDYWLHGGSIKDIFKTIKNGWPAKGMKSWATDLTPIQIKDVASYIKTLHGTNPPDAKAPQGDLYQEAGTTKTDSTTTVNK